MDVTGQNSDLIYVRNSYFLSCLPELKGKRSVNILRRGAAITPTEGHETQGNSVRQEFPSKKLLIWQKDADRNNLSVCVSPLPKPFSCHGLQRH